MEGESQIRPSLPGTLVLLLACAVSYFLSTVEAPSSVMARFVSITWLAGIVISLLFDWRMGLRNLIRVDVFALLALYFFTYFEFLFPQSRFDMLVIPADVVTAVQLTAIGLAAMIIGRHIDVGHGHGLVFIGQIEMRKQDLLVIYFGSFFLWGLPMWLSVEFNMALWIEELLQPRFQKAWGRGKYGDLSALLHELQLLGYVLPPIAGVITARWRVYGKTATVVVILALLVLWFVDFTGGTRNVLGIHMAGFLGGFLIVQEQLKFRTTALVSGFIAVLFVVMASMMLEFRNIGFDRYLEEERYRPAYREFADTYGGDAVQSDSGYFVDYNLWRMAQLVAAFPGMYDHIGWNLPWVALTKPIPRAFWSGKPMDLKVGLEEAIGADAGYTIAATWIGEAYVAGGRLWIVAIGLLIGMFCRFWNQLASFIRSPFPLIVFASGFYATLLLMRSLLFFTTALLPSIALVVFGAFIYHNRKGNG